MAELDFTNMRKRCALIIVKILEKRADSIDAASAKSIARDLEKEIMKSSKQMCINNTEQIRDNVTYSSAFIDIYENISRMILTNLDTKSYLQNQFILNSLVQQTFTPQQILEIAMRCPQELCPERNQTIFDEIRQEEDVAYNRELPVTTQYRCKKCKQHKCAVNQAQLRSADESMTTLVTCLNCGNKWMF